MVKRWPLVIVLVALACGALPSPGSSQGTGVPPGCPRMLPGAYNDLEWIGEGHLRTQLDCDVVTVALANGTAWISNPGGYRARTIEEFEPVHMGHRWHVAPYEGPAGIVLVGCHNPPMGECNIPVRVELHGPGGLVDAMAVGSSDLHLTWFWGDHAYMLHEGNLTSWDLVDGTKAQTRFDAARSLRFTGPMIPNLLGSRMAVLPDGRLFVAVGMGGVLIDPKALTAQPVASHGVRFVAAHGSDVIWHDWYRFVQWNMTTGENRTLFVSTTPAMLVAHGSTRFILNDHEAIRLLGDGLSNVTLPHGSSSTPAASPSGEVAILKGQEIWIFGPGTEVRSQRFALKDPIATTTTPAEAVAPAEEEAQRMAQAPTSGGPRGVPAVSSGLLAMAIVVAGALAVTMRRR